MSVCVYRCLSQQLLLLIFDRVAGEIIRLVASMCVWVCVSVYGRSPVWTIWPRLLAWKSTLTLASLGLYVKVVRQRSRSNSENCLRSTVWTSGAEQVDVRLSLPSSANGNCEWPLPVHWNCLFVSNHGAFNVSRVSGRSALILALLL